MGTIVSTYVLQNGESVQWERMHTRLSKDMELMVFREARTSSVSLRAGRDKPYIRGLRQLIRTGYFTWWWPV